MTKTKKLREKIAKSLCADNNYNWDESPAAREKYLREADQVVELLAEMGCGFKVEKELPYNPFEHYPDIPNPLGTGILSIKEIVPEAYQDMLQASFTGFEPIERQSTEETRDDSTT